MRVCFVFFVCGVLVASAIARPDPEGRRARRNQPVYEDEIDDHESHQKFLDEFFNGKPIRWSYDKWGRVTKNVAESSESDEHDERESSESDEDDSFQDTEEEDQDDQSEEETGGYENNEIDDDIPRGQSKDRKRAPYVPRVQEPVRFDDDIDNDVSETGRRPSPPYYERPVGKPSQFDEYDEGILRNREPQVQGQGTQPRSGECTIYCSGPESGGLVYAQIRSICGCGDYQMQYKK